MISTAQALYQFWNSFGLSAYTEDTIPDDAQLPYITYSLVESEILSPTSHYAQVWYRDTGNVALSETVAEIKSAIGEGVRIPCEGGYVVLRPSTPFAQLMVDSDPEIRRAYINLQINCYHT